MLFEPPRTQGDLHFRLFDFPVRVHPFFWLVAVFLGLDMKNGTPPVQIIIWIVAMLVSILVHELGHAFLQRRYGGRPRIVLHGFGGLAISEGEERSPKSQIEISLAGPCAGFLLAAATFLLVRLSGHAIGWQSGREFNFEKAGLSEAFSFPLLLGSFYWEPYAGKAANYLVSYFMQINILWGLMNLLPLYPLDGGQVARELLTVNQPQRGILLSLQLSMAVGGLMALYGLVSGQLFLAFLFGYLAYGNWRTYQSYGASRW
ncbi:M50 family metallopeptidase [Adhaeretor mobilis]|uniref:Peptidase family M50 n=1 Tax=Adhaeretor mobilis TaxID=1930276 RepID=A0A517N234_9BACT|nr:M50 family metallopeptidase [Adhaeretor mobilis]QDT01184.1 Peptidase family M50 [Adhaeretor mobilis]